MMRTSLALALALLVIAAPAFADDKPATKPAVKKDRPLVQLAVLLDTSGSMNGLINQARAQIWRIVNHFARARRGGQLPRIELALFEYGKNSLGGQNGYMRRIVPLTHDLDKVSEELFALVTGGSHEYCGQVIGKAVADLKWSASNKDFKAIFIAGNEPFTQGTVPYQTACSDAIKKGITVNTIYCGPQAEGINGKWQHGAELADGQFMSIDHNQKMVKIDAPQDKKITDLNTALNKTYIAYGSKKTREAQKKRQTEQDSNAEKAGGQSAQQRFQSKVRRVYDNSHWDLCDAVNQKKVDLATMKKEDLPEVMQKMTLEERKKYVAKKQKERADIQAQIKKLGKDRAIFVANKRKELSGKANDSFDDAVVKTVTKQLAKKGYTLKKETGVEEKKKEAKPEKKNNK